LQFTQFIKQEKIMHKIIFVCRTHNPSPSGAATVHSVPVCLIGTGVAGGQQVAVAQSGSNLPLVLSNAVAVNEVAAYVAKRLPEDCWLEIRQVFGLAYDKDSEADAVGIAKASSDLCRTEAPAGATA
jgi:hypothetical protein